MKQRCPSPSPSPPVGWKAPPDKGTPGAEQKGWDEGKAVTRINPFNKYNYLILLNYFEVFGTEKSAGFLPLTYLPTYLPYLTVPWSPPDTAARKPRQAVHTSAAASRNRR